VLVILLRYVNKFTAESKFQSPDINQRQNRSQNQLLSVVSKSGGQTAVPIGFFSRRHFEAEHFVLVDSLPRQWGEMD